VQRRKFLKTALLALPICSQGQQNRAIRAYVGSYTTEQRHARGDGIHVYRVDPATGAWTHQQHVGDLINPSFLISSPDSKFLYSVHGDESYATAFSVSPSNGNLTLLNRGQTGGVNGVHPALSGDGRFLVVANYGSGSVAVLPVHPDGSPGDYTHLVKLEGAPGPNRIEQAASHPHQIVFDPSGRFVLVPDKGLDRVFIFRFNAQTGKLSATEQASVETRSGAGPRHLAFHPKLPVVWVLNELNSTTATYSWDARTGVLQPRQILPSLPPGFTGNSTAAEIAVSPDARFLYCSNRGHDSIATYRIDPKTGHLASAGWTPSRGKVPRFIGFDPTGRFLYSANEQDDTITSFRRNPTTGKLTPIGQPLRSMSPVTFAFTKF
jgi:6-phosphogluconolactonase